MAGPKYPAPRNRLFDPPEILGELRRLPMSKVTIWDGRQVWLATRYEDVTFVLGDSRFSSDIKNPGFPVMNPGRTRQSLMANSLGFMDNPRHAEVRRTLANYFLPRRIDELRPTIERIVLATIDRILDADPPVDLYSAFALSIPSRTVAELLGAPSVDARLFEEYTAGLVSPEGPESFAATMDGFYALCERILTQEDVALDDGPLVRLRSAMHAGRVGREEACMATLNLFAAGHVSTATMISLGVLMLLLDAEFFRAMREEPEVVPSAVEELFRYHTTINNGLSRVATEDVLVGGALISKGDGIIASLASANRDELVFDAPDVFDFRRATVRRHMSFGHGMHKCLGQWLARAELEVALPALTTRIPTLRLAVPLEEISFKDVSHLFGVEALPVAW